jgi:hypothetical protein
MLFQSLLHIGGHTNVKPQIFNFTNYYINKEHIYFSPCLCCLPSGKYLYLSVDRQLSYGTSYSALCGGIFLEIAKVKK